jgi:mRNA interferase RelE/StbE
MPLPMHARINLKFRFSSMSYNLKFKEEALKEWSKLDSRLRDQIKKKLRERLINPRVPAAKLSGQKDRYKIKLRHVGYRLVYEVRANERAVVVVAIGKRERNAVYKMAAKRS